MSRANLAVAVAAALASATGFGAASALQHEQAGEVARRGALDPRVLASLARRPIWLLGIAADAIAVALQLLALRFGPVVLVQPLLVAALPVAVVLSAALGRRRVSRSETVGLLLCGLGLVLLVPGSATTHLGGSAGTHAWTLAAASLVGVDGLLLLLARRSAAAAPVAIGSAAGVAAGASAVLLALCAARLDDPIGLLATPAPYAAIVVGGLALMLTQAAFQTGAIAAPLAALTVSEPIVAVALAVAVLHERLPRAAVPRAAGMLGAAAAVYGVVVLARARGAAVSAD
ncbi:MAG: hypothetical protein JWP11_3613 [Frankiales bacterium]|nr:hypothetical protein [Frankiales bacterium]